MSAKRRKRRESSGGRTPQQRAQAGFRGYPVATVAYYGPDNQFASKVVAGIVLEEGGEAAFLERWFSQGEDVRTDAAINQQVADFISRHHVKSVLVTDRIVGCPHEEGKDYPLGENCPHCPYWANRDRWTGELTGEAASETRMVTGCAWYRLEQWERLLEISEDRDKLGETYAAWAANAEERLQEMRQIGIRAEKVEVDVEELLAWCRAQGREVDGAARAAYAAEVLRRRDQGQGPESGG
jgi:hypothetical protein